MKKTNNTIMGVFFTATLVIKKKQKNSAAVTSPDIITVVWLHVV